ncbi:MAG TPA: hypothetical protein PK294_10830 [Ignavibacteria bacterium]|nr:hypothetical protein [Ignavibacteria bacterium]HRB00919.1 hypothetical protein [Ignavibacteria bacterium]
METHHSPDKKHIAKGILIGFIILILAAVAAGSAFLMVSVIVMGCVKSPPEWVYMLVLFGFPIPLIMTSIVVPYLYIKKQKVIWMVLTPVAGIILSCMIFFVWFLILTRYC